MSNLFLSVQPGCRGVLAVSNARFNSQTNTGRRGGRAVIRIGPRRTHRHPFRPISQDLDDIEDENEQLKQENKTLLKVVGQLTR